MKIKRNFNFSVRAVVFAVLAILFQLLFFVIYITLTGYTTNGPVIWLTRLNIPTYPINDVEKIPNADPDSKRRLVSKKDDEFILKKYHQSKEDLNVNLEKNIHELNGYDIRYSKLSRYNKLNNRNQEPEEQPRLAKIYDAEFKRRKDKQNNEYQVINDLDGSKIPQYEDLTGLPLTKYADKYYRNYYSTDNARKSFLYFPSIPIDYPTISDDSRFTIGYTHEYLIAMVLLGLGLLYSSIKCTGFSGVALVYFLAAFTFLWASLVVPWIMQSAFDITSPEEIYYNIRMMMELMYCVFSIVIAYGALVGRISRIQMLMVSVFGVLLYTVNRMVVVRYLVAQDAAGSMTVHTFGAFYGLAISFSIFAFYKSCYYKDPCCVPADYTQTIISFIGTLFLFIFFPKFNVYFALLGTEMYEWAHVNTYFAMASGIVIVYALSTILTKCQKLDIIHLARASIAAGAALSSIAVLNLDVWGAVLVGILAAILSVLSFIYIQPYLCKLYIYDPIGIFSIFVIGGIVGGVTSAVMASLVPHLGYSPIDLSILYPSMLVDIGPGAIRGAYTQGGYQMLALFSSIAIGTVGGLLVGLIIRYMGPLDDDEIYDDNTIFNLRGCNGNAICCDNTKCAGGQEQRQQQQETDCC